MRTFTLFFLVILFADCCQGQSVTGFVPAGGNAWISGGSDQFDNKGELELIDPSTTCTTYIGVGKGELNVSVILDTESLSRLRVMINGTEKVVTLQPGKASHPFGVWVIDKEGYVAVEVQGVSKSGTVFGKLKGLMISGNAVSESSSFVPSNDGNFFYWGRRGPSVHLRFETGNLPDVEYFYSEIMVPDQNDVVGSYFMANGFSDGYFGFQVNSDSERRILFSVWSPYQTDDPKSIPESDRVLLVRKGNDVYTGEFGNEGSGGQSFLRYMWKAGVTYGFLLRAQPFENSATIYTAWFFAPEEKSWKLIASWRRPRKATYLQNLYSFLENFVPETGNLPRMAEYGNQWVCNSSGNWSELNTATFTGDQTAKKGYRKDYAGGVNKSAFYLRNCGFFNDFVALDQRFLRTSRAEHPSIDFKALP